MKDPRIEKAAKILVEHSVRVKKGEYIQIYVDEKAWPLGKEVYKRVLQKGAFPKLHINMPGETYTYYKCASKEQLKHFPQLIWQEVKKTQGMIYIGAPNNTRELTGIDPKKISLRQKTLKKIKDYRVGNTKWCIFYYPTNAMAQDADMSLEEFEDFVFKATNIEWNKEKKKQVKLKKILDKGEHVRIVSDGTDLTFSIKGRTAITSYGIYNMPDGEVFMGPVETTTEGHIHFTYPAIYGGREMDDVRLEFKKGKIVKATATKNQKFLQQIIKTDKGASYLGEFGVGMNPNIRKYIKSVLFDEKIMGTIHLALGSAYKEGGGRNESAIHWDLIKDLRKNGRLYVDGKLIQKNGKFTFKL